MKLRTSVDIIKGPPDATPLLNVVLLLLLFFMLTTTFVSQPGVKIDLPVGVESAGVNTRYIVTIAAQNPPLIFFNDQLTNLETLSTRFKLIARQEPNATLVIKADRNVPHGTIVQVMNQAIQSGLSVVLATQSPSAPTK